MSFVTACRGNLVVVESPSKQSRGFKTQPLPSQKTNQIQLTDKATVKCALNLSGLGFWFKILIWKFWVRNFDSRKNNWKTDFLCFFFQNVLFCISQIPVFQFWQKMILRQNRVFFQKRMILVCPLENTEIV